MASLCCSELLMKHQVKVKPQNSFVIVVILSVSLSFIVTFNNSSFQRIVLFTINPMNFKLNKGHNYVTLSQLVSLSGSTKRKVLVLLLKTMAVLTYSFTSVLSLLKALKHLLKVKRFLLKLSKVKKAYKQLTL